MCKGRTDAFNYFAELLFLIMNECMTNKNFTEIIKFPQCEDSPLNDSLALKEIINFKSDNHLFNIRLKKCKVIKKNKNISELSFSQSKTNSLLNSFNSEGSSDLSVTNSLICENTFNKN